MWGVVLNLLVHDMTGNGEALSSPRLRTSLSRRGCRQLARLPLVSSFPMPLYDCWGRISETKNHQRRPKSTRKRNTPESADKQPFRESAFSGVLRFRLLFFLL